MARSILAVIAGYITMVAGVVIVDLLIRGISQGEGTPSPLYYLFNLSSGAVLAGMGGYVAATIARRAELKHAAALTGLAVLLGIVSLFAYRGQQPLWYQLSLIVLLPPAVLLGGFLRAQRAQHGAGAPPGP